MALSPPTSHCTYCLNTGPANDFERINGQGDAACRNQGACLVRQYTRHGQKGSTPPHIRMAALGAIAQDIAGANERGDVTDTAAGQAAAEIARRLNDLYALTERVTWPRLPLPQGALGNQVRDALVDHLRTRHNREAADLKPGGAGLTIDQLAELDPCSHQPRFATEQGPVAMGRDRHGFQIKRTTTMDFRVSECCGKDATTADGTDECVIVCRMCKRPIPDEIGGSPAPPYIGVTGRVTATTALGWAS